MRRCLMGGLRGMIKSGRRQIDDGEAGHNVLVVSKAELRGMIALEPVQVLL
jgi:hypothetical protein